MLLSRVLHFGEASSLLRPSGCVTGDLCSGVAMCQSVTKLALAEGRLILGKTMEIGEFFGDSPQITKPSVHSHQFQMSRLVKTCQEGENNRHFLGEAQLPIQKPTRNSPFPGSILFCAMAARSSKRSPLLTRSKALKT